MGQRSAAPSRPAAACQDDLKRHDHLCHQERQGPHYAVAGGVERAGANGNLDGLLQPSVREKEVQRPEGLQKEIIMHDIVV